MSEIPRALGLPVPVVPPPAVTRAVTAARRALGRTHDRMTAPFQVVLERMFGVIDNKALFVAVDLGIPDLVAGGPQSAADLARSAGAEEDALNRLLRYLVSRGVFRQERDGRYANNAASEFLRADHPWSWRSWVLFFGSPWNWDIWKSMDVRIRGAGDAVVAAHGCDFFTFVNEVDPSAGVDFNKAMASGSRMQALLFAEHYDLAGVRTVCDVGGGSGSVLAHILTTFPATRGVLLELPSLADDAARVFDATGVADRAEFAPGDFFESVPGGCDLYLLFSVIHDWGDDDCVAILRTIASAMTPGSRLAVVEPHVERGAAGNFAKASDMLMLALTAAGRERSLAEFDALWRRADLTERRRVVLPSLFDVFELIVARP
ncbi:MAG: hydroxyneurosporene methyltransferase [Acidimicrobiia bacterium]|nr:hydroxyneurosporene methyltransferase [Acidimicrobiia bacterium]